MYLLDTNIVSNFRKRPHPNLVAWLDAISADEIAISAITVFEIQAGIDMVGDRAKAKEIQVWLDGLVLSGQASIVAFDADVARVYAHLFTTAALKNFLLPDARNSRPKSGADLIIAATAIVHEAVVVTANTDDFLRIHEHFPLPGLYHPFAQEWQVDPRTRHQPPSP
ncbi:type II toxin-antitoxin system VapC family toxin [Azospirillum sp. YIM B02556]|uniref:Ribonuclease VapC n=1 Tax=Azospirillum endophyticum TaxID=2800326 RepID=A0ABS1EYN1_9PROT|nr:type II toxin-antitoxin system VapC family toxin [Azospirillum endophyticum]